MLAVRQKGVKETVRQSRARPTPRPTPPTPAPGHPRQDLLDTRNQPLMLRGVALDGPVQPRHVEVQRPESRRLSGACGSEGQ